MSGPSAELPKWAAEVEDVGRKCKHCGAKIMVVTPLALLGDNESYYCDPDTMKVAHEMEVM